MELIVEPDTYTPSIDGQGNYIDVIPPSVKLKHGLYCPCGSRGHKMFTTTSSFNSHTKTKVHQQWLVQLNRNKANFFVETEIVAQVPASTLVLGGGAPVYEREYSEPSWFAESQAFNPESVPHERSRRKNWTVLRHLSAHVLFVKMTHVSKSKISNIPRILEIMEI